MPFVRSLSERPIRTPFILHPCSWAWSSSSESHRRTCGGSFYGLQLTLLHEEETCSIWPRILFCCLTLMKVLKREAKTVGERRRLLSGNHLYTVHQFDVSTIIWPRTKKYTIFRRDEHIRRVSSIVPKLICL